MHRRPLLWLPALLIPTGASALRAQTGDEPQPLIVEPPEDERSGQDAPRRPNFDPYTITVRGLKLGMTRAEATRVLEQNQMTLAAAYPRELERKLGAIMYTIDTLEGTQLQFRLKEVTTGGPYPRFILQLTYPTPGVPQEVWAFAYSVSFAKETSIAAVMKSVIDRYGEPNHIDNSIDGTKAFLYYGNMRFEPLFNENADAAAGNTGMFIRITGARRQDKFGVLEIQVGDHSLYVRKDEAFQIYIRDRDRRKALDPDAQAAPAPNLPPL